MPDAPRLSAATGLGLSEALHRAWGLLPARLRERLYPRLRGSHARARAVEEIWLTRSLSAVRMTGPSRGVGDIALAVLGDPAEIEDAARRWFAEPPERATLDRQTVAGLHRRLRGIMAGVDLVVVNLPRLVRPLLGSDFIGLPQSVEVVIPVQRALSMVAAGEEPLRRYLRLIERNELTLRVLDDQQSLRRFYCDFYRPYQIARFGATAPERTLRFYERFADRWEVLVILERGQWVGAGTAICHEDRYRFVDVGYRDGDEAQLERGVGHALYLRVLERAAELGYQEVDLGPERPFLDDPVLRYKQKWGARLRSNPWASRTMAVGFTELSERVRELLAAVPLLYESGDGGIYRLAPRPSPGLGAQPPMRSSAGAALGLRGTLFIDGPGWVAP